jgi:uncharacterized membrane protein
VDSRRAESFSDGVFAVAITILVFNLLPIVDTVKPLTARTLADQWPAYFAYVVSFLTIGIMWLNHHGLFGRIMKVNRPLLLLNLFLLMGIVAIPFPTALVAAHLDDSLAGKVAAVTYGLVMIAISIGYGAIWTYVVAHQQALNARGNLAVRRASTLRFTAGNAGYVAATLIALVSPVSSLIMYGLLAVYYMFEHLPDPTAESDEKPAD